VISLPAIQLQRKVILQPVNLLAAGYILVLIFGLQRYLSSQPVNFLLGLMALPFVLKPDLAQKSSYRYGIVTIVWMALCFLMPVKTLLYFSVAFALLFFTESFYGKTGSFAPMVILLVCPVFQYLSDIFSFPIRIGLTKIAGTILNFLGASADVRGNTIVHGGEEYTVDPACMGLSMTIASLLSGIMLAGFYEAKYKREMRSWLVIIYLAAIFLLNILANLSRIVLVVQLNIRPETLSHDLAGLGCLLIYVLIPAVWLANFLVKQSSFKETTSSAVNNFSRKHVIAHLLILGSVVLLAIRTYNTDTFTVFKVPSSVKGYSVNQYAPGIIKLERKEALIYVKYIRGFYDTEHNPMICWSGGGYQFKNVQVEKISNRNVFTAIITNGDDKMYSAWWYDNGINNTTSQFEWRWDLLQGSRHYILINVSCSKKEDLCNEIEKITVEGILNPFFNP
jgi:exosortase N